MSQQTSAFDWQVVKTIIDHRAVSLYFKNNIFIVQEYIFSTGARRWGFKN